MPSHSSGSRMARLIAAIAMVVMTVVPAALSAQTTGRIRGRVTDAEDKAPLPAEFREKIARFVEPAAEARRN